MEELNDGLEEREWELKEEMRMEGGGNEGGGSPIQPGECEAAREAALTAKDELTDKLEKREWELKKEMWMEEGGNEGSGSPI